MLVLVLVGVAVDFTVVAPTTGRTVSLGGTLCVFGAKTPVEGSVVGLTMLSDGTAVTLELLL